VKYELGFYIPEDDILHSDRRENLKPHTLITSSALVVSLFQRVASINPINCSACIPLINAAGNRFLWRIFNQPGA
jgi:hypothetical protein